MTVLGQGHRVLNVQRRFFAIFFSVSVFVQSALDREYRKIFWHNFLHTAKRRDAIELTKHKIYEQNELNNTIHTYGCCMAMYFKYI